MSKKLSNTTYAVLGLLSFGEALSGYEVRKWAESLRFFYWSPAQSQIYSELKKLEKLGLVSAEFVPQSGKPDKRLYKINADGHAAFSEWVNDAPLEPTVLKHSLALRLFFGHAAEPERLRELLADYAQTVEEALGQLAIVEEFTQHTPGFSFPALVAEWGRRYYEAERDTTAVMLERLDED